MRTSLLARTAKMVTGGICMLDSSLRPDDAGGTHCICSASDGFAVRAPSVEGHGVHTPPTAPNWPVGQRMAVLARQ